MKSRSRLEKIPRLNDTGEVLRPEDITWKRIVDGLRGRQISNSIVIGFSVGIASLQAVLDSSTAYDRSIAKWLKRGSHGERLAIDLMIEDAGDGADQMLPLFKRTKGVDGWAMLPVPPLLPSETTAMVEAGLALYREVRRPNVLISIPGLQERLPAFEKLVTLGIPLSVELIFSPDHFHAFAMAYRNGCEIRRAITSEPASACFMTIPVDRLITGLGHFLSAESAVEAGIAMTAEIAQAAQKIRFSEPWERFSETGAQPPRLVWTLMGNRSMSRLDIPAHVRLPFCPSLGTMIKNKGPSLYSQAHSDGFREEDKFLKNLEKVGTKFATLADRLQKDEVETSIRSWIRLLESIARKSASFTTGESTQQKGNGLDS
jgi:transaldolase